MISKINCVSIVESCINFVVLIYVSISFGSAENLLPYKMQSNVILYEIVVIVSSTVTKS